MEELKNKVILELPQLLEKGLTYGTDLFHRYISFHIMMNWIAIACGIVLVAFGSWCGYQWKKFDGYDDTGWGVGTIIPIVFGIVLILSCLYFLFKLTYIPEIYIIENIIR